MGFDNRTKTMICVAIAGLLFIPAILLNIPYLAIVAAFFDWLPLPTGWMRMGGEIRKGHIAIHAAITLVAYGFLVAWLVTGVWTYSFVFLETWWLAVMAGVLMVR